MNLVLTNKLVHHYDHTSRLQCRLTGMWKNTHAGFEIGSLPLVAIEHDPLKGPFRLDSIFDFIFFVEMEDALDI